MADTILIVLIVIVAFIGFGLGFKLLGQKDKTTEDRSENCEAHIVYGKYKLKKAKRKLKETGSKNAHNEVIYWTNYVDNWIKEKYGKY